MRVWVMATIVTFAFLLGAIFACLLGALPDNAVTKSNVTQFFRQSASNHVLQMKSATGPWPRGEIVMPAEGVSVPRLGLSAAVLLGNGEAKVIRAGAERAYFKHASAELTGRKGLQ